MRNAFIACLPVECSLGKVNVVVTSCCYDTRIDSLIRSLSVHYKVNRYIGQQSVTHGCYHRYNAVLVLLRANLVGVMIIKLPAHINSGGLEILDPLILLDEL